MLSVFLNTGNLLCAACMVVNMKTNLLRKSSIFGETAAVQVTNTPSQVKIPTRQDGSSFSLSLDRFIPPSTSLSLLSSSPTSSSLPPPLPPPFSFLPLHPSLPSFLPLSHSFSPPIGCLASPVSLNPSIFPSLFVPLRPDGLSSMTTLFW